MGRDTRRSGPMLGAALASGFCASGVDVVSIGVAPTAAVSYLARKLGFGLGAVVSASHNPAEDNGIKFFGYDGRKLAGKLELCIASSLGTIGRRPTGGEVGELSLDRALIDRYAEWLVSLAPDGLAGMKVALDAANGAAFDLAPAILRRLGCEVSVVGDEPDGMNINLECGATRPEKVQEFAVRERAHVGVSFDGDADRAVFCDELGRLINGDRVMGAWCAHKVASREFEPRLAVGTVMSNGGLEDYLCGLGVNLERTQVGDKYVSERMSSTGALIGGEQSGHLIFAELGPTGDGIATAIEFLRVLRESSRPASSVYSDYEALPQILVNVSIRSKDRWDSGPKVSAALKNAETNLRECGRIVVRPSGTQPMIRVMVEARDYGTRDRVVEDILAAMREEVGGKVYSRVDLTNALGD